MVSPLRRLRLGDRTPWPVSDLAPAPTVEEVLARQSWPHHLGPYEALSQRYRILTDDRDLAGFLEELYAPMLVGQTDGEAACGRPATEEAVLRLVTPNALREGIALSGRLLLGTSPRLARLFSLLQWAINRHVIDRACTDRLLLHAGAVDRDRAAVILAGEMEAGKSTLTAGLLQRGFNYLTDEAVAVDYGLEIAGYAKPLSIDRGSWTVLSDLEPRPGSHVTAYLEQQWHIPAQQLARVVRTSQLVVIVLIRYLPGSSASVERISPGAALAGLMDCTFVANGAKPAIARVRQLAELVELVPVFRLVAGDLDEACAAVVAALDSAAPQSTDAIGQVATTTLSSRPTMGARQICR
jgi:hypothetical protein